MLRLEVFNQAFQRHITSDIEAVPKCEFCFMILYVISGSEELYNLKDYIRLFKIKEHFNHSDTLNFGAAIGSEKPKNGRARLTKPFL